MKRLLSGLITLLIGIGFTLVSLELFLRMNPRFGYNYNSFRFKSDRLNRVPTFAFLQPSPLLGYEHIPNFGTYGWVGKINSYGLVGKEYKFHKDKGAFRILVLGDSIAEQGWPCEFLEDYLNTSPLLHSRFKNFEIWNAGVTSYDVRRYALYLKYKGLSYKPDMVIIFFCLNDFDLNLNIYYCTKNGVREYYFPISEISKIYNVNSILMKHSYVYRFIILRLNSYLLSKNNQKSINQFERDGRYYLRIIKEICDNNRIPLFAVVFPYLKPLIEYNVGQRYEYQAICKVTKELKVDYLDLYKYLPEKDLYNLRANKDDYVHPSYEGHRFIAKIIYDFLLNRFFMNNPKQNI